MLTNLASLATQDRNLLPGDHAGEDALDLRRHFADEHRSEMTREAFVEAAAHEVLEVRHGRSVLHDVVVDDLHVVQVHAQDAVKTVLDDAELAAAATHEDFVCLHKFVTHDASFCQICCDCVFVIVIAMVKKLWNGSAK